jgi:peptide/nickel transport system permease protein
MAIVKKLWRHGAFRFGAVVLFLLLFIAVAAPVLGTVDPIALDPDQINTAAGVTGEFALLDGSKVVHTFWMGTDNYGRDIFSRVLFGSRASLIVAASTALLSLGVGTLLGMLAGYFRWVDMILMRFMDGLMAIPAVLLAIALVAALGAQLWTVVLAIAITEMPRVTRLVRSLVLTLRDEPFVEAARALATPPPIILWRHILPNALAPLFVQGTFVAASAILIEAILSFLGLGLPPDIPTWGNIMAEGRVQFTQYPGNVLFPALFLVPTILAINMLGDSLRDVLDPKFSKRTT